MVSLPLAFNPITYKNSPPSCYMLRPSHHPWLNHSNYTWQRVQVRKIVVMQFTPPSRVSQSYKCCLLYRMAPSSTLKIKSDMFHRNVSWRTKGYRVLHYHRTLHNFHSLKISQRRLWIALLLLSKLWRCVEWRKLIECLLLTFIGPQGRVVVAVRQANEHLERKIREHLPVVCNWNRLEGMWAQWKERVSLSAPNNNWI
jgi:hypothetical protein